MKQKVSLVLSGGGARGIAHIGVIEELVKQGYDIFSISGTSMGALVGGVFALGKLEEYKKWLFTLDKIKIFRLLDFKLSSRGLIKGDKVFSKMKEFIADANIEDLKIQYVAVATDIINKKEVVFSTGSIFNAIRASVSIPTIFTPVKTKNGLLVDGGVLNNIPVNCAKRIPGDLLIVVDVNASTPIVEKTISKKLSDANQKVYQKKMFDFNSHVRNISSKNHDENLGFFDLINKTIGLMTHQISQASLKNYSPDVLIEISHEICNMFDFFKAEELVEIGRHAAIESLKNIPER